ncbi:helix-turn-helix transcriptional regulator [Candidatus Woesearchaeota archaeon]|nr:helix-turn-helix transcriptional regulator [Candidatus Woesearchaeota archaeon]
MIEVLRERPMNVTEIMEETGHEQSLISHNLKRLIECGFVTAVTNGREKTCMLNKNTIKPLLELMNTHMENYCCKVVEEKEGVRPKIKQKEKVKLCH